MRCGVAIVGGAAEFDDKVGVDFTVFQLTGVSLKVGESSGDDDKDDSVDNLPETGM
jgi:hypothetical protein